VGSFVGNRQFFHLTTGEITPKLSRGKPFQDFWSKISAGCTSFPDTQPTALKHCYAATLTVCVAQLASIVRQQLSHNDMTATL